MSAMLRHNISGTIHKADPFPFYAGLRENSPVVQLRLSNRRSAWLVTRYADAWESFQNKQLVKNPLSVPGARGPLWTPSLVRPLLKNMLDVDEPDHSRLRRLVNKAFTPSRVRTMHSRIEKICEERLMLARAKPSFDLITDYAQPLPALVIAEMLGVPTSDIGRFTRWSNAIVSLGSSNLGMVLALPKLWSFLNYIRKLIRFKRNSSRDDLLAALIQAEEAGDRLHEDELLAMVFLLLVAGFETTVNLIGNGMHALLNHPRAMEAFRTNSELDDSAIEELLRYCGPLELATERYSTEEIEIAGVRIPRGELVFVAICSANRDERHFPQPNDLLLDRHPNDHLSFGIGPHYCLGASLARLEARTAFRTLFNHTSSVELAVSNDRLKWKRGIVPRGLNGLPVQACWAN